MTGTIVFFFGVLMVYGGLLFVNLSRLRENAPYATYADVLITIALVVGGASVVLVGAVLMIMEAIK